MGCHGNHLIHLLPDLTQVAELRQSNLEQGKAMRSVTESAGVAQSEAEALKAQLEAELEKSRQSRESNALERTRLQHDVLGLHAQLRVSGEKVCQSQLACFSSGAGLFRLGMYRRASRLRYCDF